jgi:DNA-binding GntR family transcriptional regulator
MSSSRAKSGAGAKAEASRRRPLSRSAPVAAPEQGATLTAQAYERLEELIVRLELAPNSLISEHALSKHLGVGRTPIREALQRLAREGLVIILPRRGMLVAPVDIGAQMRLIEVRRRIEELLAAGSARRASAEQRRAFHALADAMELAAQRADDVTFMRLDREFNTLLTVACRNEFAAAAIGLFAGLSRRFWYFNYQRLASLPKVARLHAAVARAVALGDDKGARRASNALMDHIAEFTASALRPES